MEYTMTPPTATAMPVANTISYAGFWKRFLASILDGLIGGAAFTIILLIVLASSGGIGRFNEGYQPAATAGIILMYVFFLVGSWLYPALMESSKFQATVGKLALGLKVTDLDGNRISFGRATGRYFAKILSSITLCIGYIMAAFTPKKQAMHDMIASTLVLSKQATVPAQVAQNAYSGQS
jgi:uncharacterized RDD family membrane protein YckC